MLIRSLKGLLAASAVAILGGCSTPCDAPGRLCAPIVANTSAPAPKVLTGERAVPAPAPPEAASVQTHPVDAPPLTASAGSAPSAPAAAGATRIALLLPLRSASLSVPAEALRAGFMAAYERDRAGFIVNLVDSGESAPEALAAYAGALEQNDIVVGPLARSAVYAVATRATVSKPTIALNHPEARAGEAESTLPQQMLVMGLSMEDEARQVANWAAAENPGASALIVSGSSAWQRRTANAFAAQWNQLGLSSQVAELAVADGNVSGASLGQLKTRVNAEAPALLFAALDAGQLGQVRMALDRHNLPVYGTSSVNPGTEPGSAMVELDGIRVLDMPWQVLPDHSAVMVYPRWSAAGRTPDMDRLYALGIDAFRVAREITLHPAASFMLDGVTGRLQVSFGLGPARFERIEPAAVYQGGAFQRVSAPN